MQRKKGRASQVLQNFASNPARKWRERDSKPTYNINSFDILSESKQT